jgi:mono/diheme cytochrome c family protein
MTRSVVALGCLALAASACSVGPSEVPPWARGQGVSTGEPAPAPSQAPTASPTSDVDAGPAMTDAAARTPSPDASAPEVSTSEPDASADPDTGMGNPVDAGKASTGPTWTEFFNTYLALGTVGKCGSCHGQADNPSDTFNYLQGYYAPASFASAFIWSGGNMPLNGPTSNPQAVAALAAWVAAGAQNN